MFKNISDFSRFDNIIVTNDNIEKIRKKLNVDDYVPFTGIFNECVLIFKEGYSSHYIYYKQTDKKLVHIESYNYEKGKLVFICSFDLDFNISGSFLSDRIINVKKGIMLIKLPKNQVQNYINYVSCRYAGIIGYFYLMEKNKKTVTSKVTINPYQNNNNTENKKELNQYRSVITFDDTEITIITNNLNLLNTFNKSYNRHTESWGVRGHYRTLKSGKKVFVKAYTKGNKNKYKAKDYILT